MDRFLSRMSGEGVGHFCAFPQASPPAILADSGNEFRRFPSSSSKFRNLSKFRSSYASGQNGAFTKWPTPSPLTTQIHMVNYGSFYSVCEVLGFVGAPSIDEYNAGRGET